MLVGNEIEKTCLKIHGWALYNTLQKGLWNTNGLFKTYLWTHLHLQTFKASIALILIRTLELLSDQDSHNAKADISTRKAFLQTSRCRCHLCTPRRHLGLYLLQNKTFSCLGCVYPLLSVVHHLQGKPEGQKGLDPQDAPGACWGRGLRNSTGYSYTLEVVAMTCFNEHYMKPLLMALDLALSQVLSHPTFM